MKNKSLNNISNRKSISKKEVPSRIKCCGTSIKSPLRPTARKVKSISKKVGTILRSGKKKDDSNS